MLLLNSVIYQRFSSIFTPMKAVSYDILTDFFLFLERKILIILMPRRTPYLSKDCKLYYQRIGNVVLLMKERIKFFGSSKH